MPATPPLKRTDVQPPVAPARGREFAALDGLRAWAVLMVFDVHFFDGWWKSDYGFAPSSTMRDAMAVVHTGHVGVDLFFVLSGFIIHHTLAKRPARFFPFMRRRYERLLPAHLAVIAPSLVAFLVAGGSLWQAAANAVLVQRLIHGCKVLSFVTWSLSYELAWYALASAWFFASARARIARSWTLFVGVLAACYAAHALGPPRLDGIGLEVPNLARFAGFFFGFAVGRVRSEQPAWFSRLAPVLRALAIPSVIAVLALRYLYTRLPDAARTAPTFECAFYGALDLAFAIVMAGTLAGRGFLARLLAQRPLQWLGGVSYSFYLVHALYGIPVGAAVAARLAEGSPMLASPLVRMALGWGIGFAATSAMAAFLFAYLEAPYFRRPSRAADPT